MEKSFDIIELNAGNNIMWKKINVCLIARDFFQS
jgi:hypothetical protein